MIRIQGPELALDIGMTTNCVDREKCNGMLNTNLMFPASSTFVIYVIYGVLHVPSLSFSNCRKARKLPLGFKLRILVPVMRTAI